MLFHFLHSDYFSWDFVVSWLVFFRGFICSKKYVNKSTLNGKTVIITGGSSGIGRETALDLARRGARVIFTYTTEANASETLTYIFEKVPKAVVSAKYLNLASFSSIYKFANEVLENEPKIHLLINNAGLVTSKSETEEGFELHFGVNYLGHFLLTKLLLDRLKESAPARIINVSSVLHFLGKIDFNDLNLDRYYNPFLAYGRSKLCNILFTRELAKRLQGTKVSTYSLHPAAVQTNIDRHPDSVNKIIAFLYRRISELLFQYPENGIGTILYCALEESITDESGSYYCECTKVEPFPNAKDEKLAKDLWDLSEKLISQKKVTNSATIEKKDL